MLFKNNIADTKLRIGGLSSTEWKDIKLGEVVDLPEDVGNRLKFDPVEGEVPVTQGEINGRPVETKQVAVDGDFMKELISIKGIGKKTAQDIMQHYPTKEALLENLDYLGLRDDVEEKLKEAYAQ